MDRGGFSPSSSSTSTVLLTVRRSRRWRLEGLLSFWSLEEWLPRLLHGPGVCLHVASDPLLYRHTLLTQKSAGCSTSAITCTGDTTLTSSSVLYASWLESRGDNHGTVTFDLYGLRAGVAPPAGRWAVVRARRRRQLPWHQQWRRHLPGGLRHVFRVQDGVDQRLCWLLR